ncbi:MAG: LysE family transporter [Methanoculleaceae archaeon]
MAGITGIVAIFTIAFIVGLTGTLVPGPTLVATVGMAVRRGWRAGPLVTLGHIIVEAVICMAIVAGACTIDPSWTRTIAIAGGCVLIVSGGLTLRQTRSLSINLEVGGSGGNAVAAGVITSVANPYFWIWWLSVGSAFLITGLQDGIFVAVAFMAGHWSADLGWYTIISAGIDRGRMIISVEWYRRILFACGIFLIGFGIWFLVTGAVLPLSAGG